MWKSVCTLRKVLNKRFVLYKVRYDTGAGIQKIESLDYLIQEDLVILFASTFW